MQGLLATASPFQLQSNRLCQQQQLRALASRISAANSCRATDYISSSSGRNPQRLAAFMQWLRTAGPGLPAVNAHSPCARAVSNSLSIPAAEPRTLSAAAAEGNSLKNLGCQQLQSDRLHQQQLRAKPSVISAAEACCLYAGAKGSRSRAFSCKRP